MAGVPCLDASATVSDDGGAGALPVVNHHRADDIEAGPDLPGEALGYTFPAHSATLLTLKLE